MAGGRPREGTGLGVVWERLQQHRRVLEATGALDAKRRDQQVEWIWSMVRDQLLSQLREHPEVRRLGPALEQQVRDGTLTATLAANRLLTAFRTTG